MSTRLLALLCLTPGILLSQTDLTKRFTDPKDFKDARHDKLKDYNGYFPFTPPENKTAWNDRAQLLREQVRVGLGLWPYPEKTDLKPVIHGKIDRDDYTVEKVFFASMPGHYVSGNLYRPKKKNEGKYPAILSPHGHWSPEGPQGGRFYDAGEKNAKREMDIGAEKTMESARFPLQARCAMLARMGFIVFHYDMVGYADSQASKHRQGFGDAQAELRSQNYMGLQTWNSIRSLDFLLTLPEVDPKRIGVTGSSGGGTQTFMLCGIDDRPAAAFPAVMVSTAMQGGCVCENCSYLRIGTGNIELAALFAPKPLGMSAAKDWTIDIETKGLPELKALYKTLGAEQNVAAKCWPEFGHNYNQVAREMMYAWFNKHLLGGDGAIAEKPFKPVPPKELSVYDDAHPRPKDELDMPALRKTMSEAADKQFKTLEPTDAASLKSYRDVVYPALRAMIGESLPAKGGLKVKAAPKEVKLPGEITMHLAALGHANDGDMVPSAGVFNKSFKDKVALWIHPQGKASLFDKGELKPEVKKLVDNGYAVVAIDCFRTGESAQAKPMLVDKNFPGYTFGYNRPIFANRVRDILVGVMFARDLLQAKTIHLIGWEGAGPWVIAARALCGDIISKTSADLNQFCFENITDIQDENLLPGALKYGGLPGFMSLCAPHELMTYNHAGTSSGHLTKAAYKAAGAEAKLIRQKDTPKPIEVIDWLIK